MERKDRERDRERGGKKEKEEKREEVRMCRPVLLLLLLSNNREGLYYFFLDFRQLNIFDEDSFSGVAAATPQQEAHPRGGVYPPRDTAVFLVGGS